ncbi:MAG: stage III sporulation protein AD [Lachnospiraceae bacterium]|nr:stage III sporulation protein AD [Lachnospiraceae bacterium]
MIQAAMIGITGVFLALQIKHTKPEFAIYLSIATSIFLLFLAVQKLEVVVESVKLIQSSISVQTSYIQVLLKIIGITYISEFAADICRDAGYSTIASQIGVFSKLSILAVSMPIVSALLETIHGFLAG